MKMEMIHCLAAVFSGIDHDPVALPETFIPCNLCGDPQQMTEQAAMALVGRVQ
jgi:hypothetical protein